MRKLPPSQKMRKEIEEILKGVPEDLDNRDMLEEIVRKGVSFIEKDLEYLDKLRKEFGLGVIDEKVVGVSFYRNFGALS